MKLTDAQIRTHLRAIPVIAWTAMAQLLEDEVDAEVLSAAAPDLTDGARHFNAGRLSMAVQTRCLWGDFSSEDDDQSTSQES